MGIPNPDSRTESNYEQTKRNIKKVSSKMDQEIQTLNNRYHLEDNDTITSITASLQTLKNDITNKNQLEQAWDKFALRTSDGAKAFLKLIQNES